MGELVWDYLDACRARGRLEVRIIHGKGIGHLRRTVHAELRRQPAVERFADAGPHFGGPGATMGWQKPPASPGPDKG